MKKAVCAAVAAVLAVSMLTACVGGGNGNELSVEEPDMWTTQTQPEEVTSPKQMESETQLRNGLAATGNAPEEKLAFYEELLARDLCNEEDYLEIQVFELSRTGYDTGDAIVEEVIRGIQKAQPGDPLYVGKQSLDLDRDNVIDNLTIIVEGNVVVNNTESSFKANYGNSSSGSDKINGLSVSNYNALTSSMLFDKSVNIHEFLHSLGLPDLYRLNVSSGTEVATGPVGIWDIMASAGGQTPQYVLGYLRKKMGWLEGGSVAEITAGGTYRLTAVSQPDTAGGVRPVSYAGTLGEDGSIMEEQQEKVTQAGGVVYAYEVGGRRYLYQEGASRDTFRMDCETLGLPRLEIWE